jgi:hypothetical protein
MFYDFSYPYTDIDLLFRKTLVAVAVFDENKRFVLSMHLG